MQFLYHQDGGESLLTIKEEDFNYLFRVRRLALGDTIKIRNLRDSFLYTYVVEEVQKKHAILSLYQNEQSISTSNLSQKAALSLHLLWAIIEPKIIEKTLPMLNELNVARISFFYAQFSQAQFKLSLERMHKILIQSCQQCGRTTLMNLEVHRSFDDICKLYAPFYAFDFGGEDISCFQHKDTQSTEQGIRIIVGPEGGFSSQEREKFGGILTLNNGTILRSESACVFLASATRLWQSKEI